MADQIHNPEIRIRFPADIQKAHDTLVAVITGEVEVELSEPERLMFHSALDTLCWVLSHDHNTAFAHNLKALQDDLYAKGYRIVDTSQYCPNGIPKGATDGGQGMGPKET